MRDTGGVPRQLVRRVVPFVIALSLSGCGGARADEPGCGDGKIDSDEQCDDGNAVSGDGCSAGCLDERYGSLVVTYSFNVAEAGHDDPGVFTSDACTDFAPGGDTFVRLRTSSSETVEKTLSCIPPPERHPHTPGPTTVTLAGIPVGPQEFEFTILAGPESALKELTMPRSFSATIPPAGTPAATATVELGNADFLEPPRGALLFQTYFGDKSAGSCAATSPPVANQRVTLRDAEGNVVQAQTDDATPTDGQTLGACRWPGADDAQRIKDLPSGRYHLSIVGVAADGHDAFCAEANVFVGAGEKNPTYPLVALPCP
jgi:cysteine-rich repeat protein